MSRGRFDPTLATPSQDVAYPCDGDLLLLPLEKPLLTALLSRLCAWG